MARISDVDDRTAEHMTRATLELLAETSYDVPPPKIAHELYPMLCRLAGTEDPYRELKSRYNEIASKLAEKLVPGLLSSEDPFRQLLKLSLAGNIIDFGIGDQFDLDRTVREAFESEPEVDEIDALAEAIDHANKVLYLADNTGEIAFDTAWIRHSFDTSKLEVVVRSGPIINDATATDASQVGLDRIVTVTDPGIAVPGTWLGGSSERFLESFHEADLVISKGQGNFETLFGEKDTPPIFFIFMVKCPVVSSMLKLPQGSRVAAFHDTLSKR